MRIRVLMGAGIMVFNGVRHSRPHRQRQYREGIRVDIVRVDISESEGVESEEEGGTMS